VGQNIQFEKEKIVRFCQKWKINEFALFRSALRDDFHQNSDIDVLVTFAPEIPWSLWDWIDMIDELKDIFKREVDLVEKSGLRNPFRRQEILINRQVIYAA
jgi:uncharacterized protein